MTARPDLSASFKKPVYKFERAFRIDQFMIFHLKTHVPVVPVFSKYTA